MNLIMKMTEKIKIVMLKAVKIKAETMMVYQEHDFGTVSSQLL